MGLYRFFLRMIPIFNFEILFTKLLYNDIKQHINQQNFKFFIKKQLYNIKTNVILSQKDV